MALARTAPRRKSVFLPAACHFAGSVIAAIAAVLLQASTPEGGASTLGATFGVYVGAALALVSTVPFSISVVVCYQHSFDGSRLFFSGLAGGVSMLVAALLAAILSEFSMGAWGILPLAPAAFGWLLSSYWE
jgi:hypothetical protein